MEHHETKTNLLKAAAQLFLEKGYDRTSVQDLIDAVGIAKGTFYHHFKSKEEVLTALMDQLIALVMDGVRVVAEKPGLGAVQRINAMFTAIRQEKTRQVSLMAVLVSQAINGVSGIPLEYLYRKLQHSSGPYWQAFIQQGLEEGVFRSAHPRQLPGVVARTVFSFVFSIPEVLGNPATAAQDLQSLALAYQEALERMLGAPEGSLKFTVALGAQDVESVMGELKSREERIGKTESAD